jgi:hypothetical protein
MGMIPLDTAITFDHCRTRLNVFVTWEGTVVSVEYGY